VFRLNLAIQAPDIGATVSAHISASAAVTGLLGAAPSRTAAHSPSVWSQASTRASNGSLSRNSSSSSVHKIQWLSSSVMDSPA
jgi:hypothetical protein